LARFGSIEAQETVDDTYWRPMARRLQDSVPDRVGRQRISPKDTIVDWYLREWLMRDGGRVDSPRVYKTLIERTPPDADAASHTFRSLEALSHHYVRLEKPESSDPFASTLTRLRSIGYNVHWPLLMQLMERASTGDFETADVGKTLDWL